MGWVVSVTPRPRFSPGKRTPGTHCTGGWVGPRAGLDKETKGKILCPCQGSSPDRPVVQPVVRHYTAWANPAHMGWSTCHKTASIQKQIYQLYLKTCLKPLMPIVTNTVHKAVLLPPCRRQGGEEYASYSFLISALYDVCVCVVSVMPRPGLSPGKRTPGTHCTGGLVGLRAGLDTEARGKILLPVSAFELRSSCL
jgi:hypothetical protein